MTLWARRGVAGAAPRAATDATTVTRDCVSPPSQARRGPAHGRDYARTRNSYCCLCLGYRPPASPAGLIKLSSVQLDSKLASKLEIMNHSDPSACFPSSDSPARDLGGDRDLQLSSSESYESLPEYADFTFFRRGMIEMRCTSRLQRAMPLDGEQQR